MSFRLRELRLEKGMSQQQLGIKFNIGKTTVSHYENSERDVPTESLMKFAKYFGVTTDYLLGVSDSRTNPNDRFSASGADANKSLIFGALDELDFSRFSAKEVYEYIELMRENALQISRRRDTDPFTGALNVAEERSKNNNN